MLFAAALEVPVDKRDAFLKGACLGDRSLRADLGWTFILEAWRNHKFEPLPEQAARQAVEIFRSLVAETPGDPFVRDDLVWALWRLSQHTQRDKALVLLDDAITIGDQLVREFPASAEFRRELSGALENKAVILSGGKPTPQSAALAMPFMRRGLELNTAILADLKSNRLEILQPQRPKSDQGRIFSASPVWAEFDVAERSEEIAHLYQVQSDWRDAAEMYDQSVSFFKDLVEHNPSVATYNMYLNVCFGDRVAAATQANDRQQVAALSKDAVAYWNRLVELHPDLPALKTYADKAAKEDAEVAKWLAQAATAQAPATPP
jgi:tetratricopeptide (TPR) repeat protein